MTHEVLSLKWRPQTFQEVIGQEHITRSFQNAILKNQIGHAYLLAGTRGIGKTSMARIFAKALRCENRLQGANPCYQCRSCKEIKAGLSMNVVEIDGASNNSVEDIRDLINRIQSLPTFGSYKIYIIDEVHMLSTSAFNAMLKTLEEPPEHIIFIFATTEPEKLLSTVLSRCQRFDFKNASIETLVKHITHIAEKENIQFNSPGLIRTVCIQGNGSFRDTLSLIDQILCFSGKKIIDENTVSKALGLSNFSSIRKLTQGMLEGNLKLVGEVYCSILQENVDLENICRSILDHLYEILNQPNSTNYSIQEILWVYEALAQDFEWALKSLSPEKTIEIIFHKITLRRNLFLDKSTTKKEIVKEETLTQENKLPAKNTDYEQLPNNKIISWPDFIHYVRNISPVMASNLEQGNILQNIDFSLKEICAQIGFKPSGKVFYDYLKESQADEKLREYLASYTRKDLDSISVQLIFVDGHSGKNENFKTQIETTLEDEKALNKKREQQILAHPIIQQAKEIFHSKINNVELNT